MSPYASSAKSSRKGQTWKRDTNFRRGAAALALPLPEEEEEEEGRERNGTRRIAADSVPATRSNLASQEVSTAEGMSLVRIKTRARGCTRGSAVLLASPSASADDGDAAGGGGGPSAASILELSSFSRARTESRT